MTTATTAKPLPPEVVRQMLDQMDAALNEWTERGYCPVCVARTLLGHAGLFAAHELQPDDMRRVLAYIAALSKKHAPPGGVHLH